MPANAQNFKVIQEPDGYIIEINITDLHFIKENNNDSIPVVSNTTGIFEKGCPELPKFSYSFQTQSPQELNLQVIEDRWKDINASVSPSLGFVYQNQEPGDRIKGDVYLSDNFYPENPTRIFPVHSIKNRKEQVIWFFPLQYNPQNKILRVHTYLKLRLKCETTTRTSAKYLKSAVMSSSEKMLIITPDSFRNTLLPFIKWKNQKGIEVLLLSSDTLGTAQNIKTAVKDYYTNFNISYLLLVGDHNQTPATSSIYGPSDYSYGILEGNDYYIDICVGRFPSKNKTHLESMIFKTISYEQASGSAQWLKTFGGLASKASGDVGGDNGESDFQHIMKIGQLFKSNSYTQKIIYEGAANNIPISSLINDGCGYLFYIGHGNQTSWASTPFNIDSVSKLSNYNKYPFIVDGACLNGDLTYPVCFAERLMCASGYNGATGSVAMLASTISQLWAPPMLGQDVIAKNLFNPANGNLNTTLGDICNLGFYEIINTYNYGGIETAYTWMLYGDPSLKLWTTLPGTLEISIPEVFDMAKDTFTITGPDSAIVTIMSDGKLLDTKMIIDGKAGLIKGNTVIADSVMVTVSKQNYSPKIIKLPPYSDGSSYYNINSILVSDDNNGIPESGEWIEIKPVVTNYGLIAGKNIKVEVFSHDTFLEFSPNNVTVDSVAGKTSDTLQSIRLHTLNKLPDGHTAKIGLKISDLSGQVNAREFNIQFSAPIIKTVDILVNGESTSNKNLSIPSDTATISLIVENKGHAASQLLKAKIKLENTLVHYISDTTVNFSVKALDFDTLNFTVVTDKNCIPGWYFNGYIEINDTCKYPFPFSFYYKTIPLISFDNGSMTEDEFPFYNYYKANRSQIIYKAGEMGNTAMIIDSIGFNLASIPNDMSKRSLNDFTVFIGETNLSGFNNSFISSDSLTRVFYKSSYIMPNTTGWFSIDIDIFSFSGNKNIIVEIMWGLNTSNTGYNNVFTVVSHVTAGECSGFGYNDFKSPSPWTNSSNIRPDIRFSGKLVELNKVFLYYNNKDTINLYDTVYLHLGEKWFMLNSIDSAELNLPAGKYSFIVAAAINGKTIQKGDFEVTSNNQLIEINISNQVKACKSYNWNGNVYTASGTYSYTYKSYDGNDSTVILNLAIVKVDTSLKVTNNTINIAAKNSISSVLNCSNNQTITTTENSFTAVESGSYSVIIKQDGCTDTSRCVNLVVASLNNPSNEGLEIYPNPAHNEITLKFPDFINNGTIHLINPDGKLVHTLNNIDGTQAKINISQLSPGFYIIEFIQEGIASRKIIIKQ